jgi:hypothetical protein
MMNLKPTLSHHLCKVTIRELIATIPTNTEQDNFRLEMSPLEGVCVALPGSCITLLSHIVKRLIVADN